ncbi:MAG: ORF6N domain-containing protein [Patescibacteria group bacterium]|nr:ORF6N domain-containing protein [Patescibacteria group bacterium]
MYTRELIPTEAISQRIFIIRGVKVMFDADLAELYGVTTKRLNEQVKRNLTRFPADFMFQLTLEEIELFNRSQIATGSQKHRDPRFLPYVFTEHGVAMLSAVLRSERAIEMSVYIVRAFIKLREMIASNKELGNKVKEIEREQKLQNRHINAIYRILDKLIEEPVKKAGHMGFNPPSHSQ